MPAVNGLAGRRWAVLLLPLLRQVAASNSSFAPGAICEGVNTSSLASEMLRGKHLIINELEWSPYASPSTAAPTGWVGMNPDLFKRIADMLGFTFEIRDMGYPQGNESWTDLLLRAVNDADLTGCWWVHGASRNDNVFFLRGHVDSSTSLVAVMQVVEKGEDQKFRESFYNFMMPFDNGLWVMILLMVIFSGVVDYIVESQRLPGETKLTASLYEYFAGILWGGFEYPLSRTSAVYQIALGFLMLIFISSYTANLAAFITVSAVPTASVDGMASAVYNQQAICLVDYTSERVIEQKVQRLYPRIALADADVTSDQMGPADKLNEGEGCEGLLVPRTDYDGYRTDPKYCRLSLAQTVFTSNAGWATNKESWCVNMAISHALLALDLSGELQALYSSYIPEAPCELTSVAGDSTGEASEERRRRRLQAGPGPAAGQPPRMRRRLKGAGKGGEGGEGGVPRMKIDDFAGLFVGWGILSAVILTLGFLSDNKRVRPYMQRLRAKFKKAGPKEPKVQEGGAADALQRTPSTLQRTPTNARLGIRGAQAQYDLDNESSMLRAVLQQLSAMQETQQEMLAGQEGLRRRHAELQTKIQAEGSQGGPPPVFM